jgi:guanylate kinase
LSSRTHPGCLFVIAAPSGGGKTSLVKALLERDPKLALSISHTTRPPRPGEKNGRHYHFVSQPEFESMAKDGEFMEHARVFDHHYGTNRNSVSEQIRQGRDVILEIDWQGARQVRAVFPDCCCIFIIPPSLDVLRTRLTGRGQDSAAVIQRRMRDAQAEISHWDEFDQLVVNNNFELTLEELRSIINDHRKQRPHKVNKDYQRLAQQIGKR